MGYRQHLCIQTQGQGCGVAQSRHRQAGGRPTGEVERLRKKVADLEQLAGDQALAIRYLKKKEGHI